MVNWKSLHRQINFKIQLKRNVFYEVVWVNDFPNGKTEGETRFQERQIALKKDVNARETVKTFLHEVAHAFAHEYDIPLPESSVEKLEEGLYFLLKKDNLFKGAKNVKRTSRKRK